MHMLIFSIEKLHNGLNEIKSSQSVLNKDMRGKYDFHISMNNQCAHVLFRIYLIKNYER